VSASGIPARRGKPPVGRGPFEGTLGPFLGLAIISIASNILLLTGPLFMLQIYDRVLASKSAPTLIALTGLMIVLYGFYALLEILRVRMATRWSGSLGAALGGTLFRTVLINGLVPKREAPGDLVRDLETIRQFVAGPGPLAVLDLPWMPIYLGLVFVFHPVLGWLAIGGAVVIVALMVCNEWLSRAPSAAVNALVNRRQRSVNDGRASAEAIAAMGMLDAVEGRWRSENTELLLAQRKAADRATLFASLTKSFRLLLQSCVLALGAFLAIQGEITAGIMIAASIVTARALSPVEQLVGSWRGFVAARQSIRRVREALRQRPSGPKTVLPLPTVSLSVSNLAVSPEESGPAVLGGVSFNLVAGDGLGILGPSASGKSTLVRTLIGILPPSKGLVRLDGADIAHYQHDRLGTSIGYLPQSVDLLNGTVAENIARFRQDVDDTLIFEAAGHAGVHELIERLPMGYDTPIGERGVKLSAGQRQRIALARAMFGSPFLLVLDEPNSNLDADGDVALNRALAAARERGAIVIVVAHRPSAIASANKLLVLQGGGQLAFGPRDEVLKAITPTPPLTVVRESAQ
jgi:ATP-binding cassette subfamily C protein PrsD